MVAPIEVCGLKYKLVKRCSVQQIRQVLEVRVADLPSFVFDDYPVLFFFGFLELTFDIYCDIIMVGTI